MTREARTGLWAFGSVFGTATLIGAVSFEWGGLLPHRPPAATVTAEELQVEVEQNAAAASRWDGRRVEVTGECMRVSDVPTEKGKVYSLAFVTDRHRAFDLSKVSARFNDPGKLARLRPGDRVRVVGTVHLANGTVWLGDCELLSP